MLPHSLTHRSSTPMTSAETFGPEEVGAAFVQRDDVGIVDVRQDPFLLAPDAGAVGPPRALYGVRRTGASMLFASSCLSGSSGGRLPAACRTSYNDR